MALTRSQWSILLVDGCLGARACSSFFWVLAMMGEDQLKKVHKLFKTAVDFVCVFATVCG